MDKSHQESPVRKSKVTLNSAGHQKMPIIGMGTAVNLLDPSALKSAVPEAIGLGYRHFDTTKLCRSDRALGEAIAEALDLGLVSSSDELFVTSKLWCSDAYSDLIVSALRESLVNLQLECLDLYPFHWPISAKQGKFRHPTPEEELLTMDFKSAWEAVEECQKLGFPKSIGVSNFSFKKLERLLARASISPSVNQVEMHPLWQQKKLRIL